MMHNIAVYVVITHSTELVAVAVGVLELSRENQFYVAAS
jgi:hypothetical protein